MTTAPAIVRGNVATAIARFIEDSRGDLVDIEFECNECCYMHGGPDSDALPWPAFDFSTDYITYCSYCGQRIHEPNA